MGGRFRIYPIKENTIASGNSFELLNSSQNTGVDLWYGGIGSRNSISRHLAQFDLTELESKLASKEINSAFITSYQLKFKNAIPSDKVLEPEYEFNQLNKKIAASFDLITFPVNKPWDEGRGFDMLHQNAIVKAQGDFNITGFSNWISATSTEDWDEPGIFANPTASTAVTQFSTQHFALGNEDINMNITNIVNDWLGGSVDNNGLAISYSKTFEDVSGDTRLISTFFSRKTNTAFKPFIEVQYDQVIKDDRSRVSNNRTSRLFLYLFSGNTAVNYFSAGTVDIIGPSNTTFATGLTPTHHSKGVYFIDVLMTGTTKGQRFKDTWKDITFQPGIDQQNFEQKFDIQGNFFTNNATEINDYAVSTYGLANNDILQSEEVVRVYVDTRINYSRRKPIAEYGLEYKLTMNNVNELISWTSINDVIIDNCLKSFFDIDTSWLLTNQNYEITLRINELGTKRILPERINFRVVDRFDPVKM